MSPIRPLQAQIFIRVHCKRKILHARYSLLARLPCAYSGRLQDSASLTRLNGSVLICNCLNVVLCLLFGTRRPKRPLTALGNSGLPNLCVVLLEPIASALDVSDTSFGTLSVRNGGHLQLPQCRPCVFRHGNSYTTYTVLPLSCIMVAATLRPCSLVIASIACLSFLLAGVHTSTFLSALC